MTRSTGSNNSSDVSYPASSNTDDFISSQTSQVDDLFVDGAGIDPPLIGHTRATSANDSGQQSKEAWWSVGEYYPEGSRVTHQSARLSLTGGRVFGHSDDVWDLSDSLAELYQASLSSMSSKHGLQKSNVTDVEIKEWVSKGSSNGFIRIYPPDMGFNRHSQLIPCTLSTTAHKICLVLGLAPNTMFVQLSGDKVRRLDPYEHPLVLQNEYLTRLGFDHIDRIQEQGRTEDLEYFIKFYAGKPIVESTFARTQTQAYIEIRKDKVMSGWSRKLCVLSGTRLLIYKDKTKTGQPSVLQLAKGNVEDMQGVKGHHHVVKLTSTLDSEKVLLSFPDSDMYNKWFRKCKKATDKLPTSADLSNCHLEFLPENVFINDQLALLNLRHNVLKERPIDEDIYTIGWLDDLPRFAHLRSLNLADNDLVTFPLALCQITTLVELNLASNKLEEIPSQIQELTNLQALHIHNNHLHNLPAELTTLSHLFILVLAFNRFTEIPVAAATMTDIKISEVENVILAGNHIERFPVDIQSRLKYAKKVDLRLNGLILPPEETAQMALLEHLTHLDIRHNFVTELDLRLVRTLEYLNCEHNGMVELQVNGMALKNLFAAHNELEKFAVSPKPEWLLQLDLSHNCLKILPDWLGECFFLQRLNVSHNCLTDLPSKLFTDSKKLKSLRANHNNLVVLPSTVENLSFEELHLHHNRLTRLPNDLLKKANKLRVLNLSKNRLTMLPQPSEVQDLNKLQELYITNNSLGDSAMHVIGEYRRLKILHLAYNEFHNLNDRDLSGLEALQEFNISGNQLRSLPLALGEMSKLVILRAHSNALQGLPDFKEATSLRILDVGHNQLLNISMSSIMASQLDLLDMCLNAQLRVDPKEFKSIKQQKSVCLVDSSGQNKVLPGLHKRRSQKPEQSADDDSLLPWKVGFSETSGIRNKLCVATLRILKFESVNESLFGIFDGGHNNEVPKLLLDKVPSIMREEIKKDPVNYMKYTMLMAHKKLGSTGQRLGASAALCHLQCQPQASVNSSSAGSVLSTGSEDEHQGLRQYRIHIGCVGDVEIVLCRHGEALTLTRKHTTEDDREECERVCDSDGIITEDNKVNGTTKNTRLLGNTYLFPYVIPDPFTSSLSLRHDDEFLILANRGLWRFVSYSEAVEEIYEIGNPVLAAKRLQDLAQAYGSKENIGILVIRLNTDRGPSLARLRVHKSMSIDDVEAAQEFEERRQRQQLIQENAASSSRKRSQSSDPMKPENYKRPVQTSTDSTMSKYSTEGATGVSEGRSTSPLESPLRTSRMVPEKPLRLKPLPKQKYRKKDIANEWETILQRRLTEDVKSKELLQLSHSVSQDTHISNSSQQDTYISNSSQISRQISEVTSDFTSNDTLTGSVVSNSAQKRPSQPTWTNKRITLPPWSKEQTLGQITPSLLYTSLSDDSEKTDGVKSNASHSESPAERKQKFRNTIALFENLNRSSEDGSPQRSPRAEVGHESMGEGRSRTTVVLIKRDARGSGKDISAEPVSMEVQTVEGPSPSTDADSSPANVQLGPKALGDSTVKFVEISRL